MIIRRIHIDNFGCFHDFDLELQQGVNILSRPNEFGKTTLLEFIRRIFWGFPDKRRKQLNPYPALNGSGHYGGWLDVTMADGREVRFERRGVRGNLKMIRGDGSVEEMENISGIAGVSENFYRNICAVTIDELTAFAAVDSDEIKNLIYGTSFSTGSVSLSAIQEKLAGKAELIFKKRGSNNLLKKLADEFAVSEERLARVAGNMAAYEKAVLNAETLEEAALKINAELEAVQKQADYCKKVLEVIQTGKSLAGDEEKFAAVKVPEPMPEPLPPFDKKAPDLPPEPVLPEQIVLPPEPDRSAVAGLCDINRAVKVTDEDIAETEKWNSAVEKHLRDRALLLKLILLPVIAGVVLIATAVSGTENPVVWLMAVLFELAAAGIWIKKYFSSAPFRNYGRLKKFREDIMFRFALNPTVKKEDIPELLGMVKELQRNLDEYGEQVKISQLREQEREQLRLEYEIRRKVYDEAAAAYSAERNEYDKKRHSFEELCRIRSKALAEYESEKLALARRREAWKKMSEEYAADDFDREKLDLLQQQYGELRQQLEENLRLSGAERREAKLLTEGVDSALELNVREQLRGRMRSAAERCLVLRAAEAVLKKAIERCERERQPELLKNASEWFSGFTCGAYTRVYRQISTGNLRVGNVQTNSDKEVSELSRGTREQFFLALRLALIQALENNSEPLPVVLDDVLVDFDPGRRKAVMESLKKFFQTRQILIFDCNSI